MLAKIKSLADTIKTAILYVVMPFLVLIALIYYAIRFKLASTAKSEVKEEEKKSNELQEERTKADSAASTSVDEFERLREQYGKLPRGD